MSKSKGYGTAFEKLEDEDGPIKKRPKRVHEEVVTDERGRRRFHGAFTGGFSAGYFNSVGSKHGWVPQTFKSSRQNRAKHDEARPEDFMDEEDLGEFGIASRQFKVNRRYVDDGMQGKAVWDRPSTSVAEKVDSDDGGIKVVGKAHSSSIGLLIMKKMGYREGKGVGAPLTRRQLEMQRIHEARAHGRRSRFDQTAVEEAEEFAAGFEFVPEDIPPVYFACKQDTHGLGYKGLSGLSGGYGALPIDAAPSKDKKKGHGAAFGVGVFEDSDDDVYGNDDIAAYNFALGGSQKRDDADPMAVVLSAGNVGNFDIKFLPAKRNRKKPPHLSIRVPSDFKPNYKAIAFDSSTLPSVIKSYAKNMTPLQRAMILGEKASNVMELLSEKDRETLRQARRIADEKKVKSVVNRQEIEIDPYPNDEAKSFRFKTYLQCLRRGVPMTQPSGIAHLQWLAEESEFQNKVPTELRYLLPDVQQRKEPLYKGDFTPNLMNQLKSRFINQDEAAVIAAKPKPLEKFQKIEWHPSKLLCKRLKVPDPFPKSEIEGTLGSKSKNKLNMGNYEYTRTAVEKELIKQNEMSNLVGTSEKEFQSDPIPDAPLTEADPLTQFFDLMDKVYGTTAEEIKEGEKLEAQFNKPLQLPPLPRKLSPPRPIPESFVAKKQKTIFDDGSDDETKNVPVKIAFVPSSKSSNSNRSESGNKFESNRSKEEKKVPVYVVSDSDTSSERSRKSRKKKSKKSKKERSHKKKERESSSKKSKHKKHSRDREHKSSKKSKKHRSYSESD